MTAYLLLKYLSLAVSRFGIPLMGQQSLIGLAAFAPLVSCPRWASRLTLRITDVRVERVQAISEADAIAEGISPMNCYGPSCASGPDGCNARGCYGVRSAYQDLWDSINGKKPGASWADNPWCWVVSFERVGVVSDEPQMGR